MKVWLKRNLLAAGTEESKASYERFMAAVNAPAPRYRRTRLPLPEAGGTDLDAIAAAAADMA